MIVMKTILHLNFLLLVAGLTVNAAEEFGEETTTMYELTEVYQEQSSDSQSSSETPDPTEKPSILDELEQVAWKIVQFDWNITSAIHRRLEGPLVKAIRMRTEPEVALARIIGLAEGAVLSGNLKKLK